MRLATGESPISYELIQSIKPTICSRPSSAVHACVLACVHVWERARRRAWELACGRAWELAFVR